jgi:4-amino-4-deoxy-L-arabinose transferase-like glycosyltransferase
VKKGRPDGGLRTVLLATLSLLFIAVMGVIAGTAMTSSTTVFFAALTVAVVFAVVLALVLETVELADEPQNERR